MLCANVMPVAFSIETIGVWLAWANGFHYPVMYRGHSDPSHKERWRGNAEMLLSASQLKTWLGVQQNAQVMKFLRKHKIAYWMAGDQPVTTLAAINARLLGTHSSDEEFNFGAEEETR